MMPMDGKEKEATFKCPSCGEELKVESSGEDNMEDNKPSKKVNAGNMPMDHLKSKIQPTTNPPGMTSPNLNSY